MAAAKARKARMLNMDKERAVKMPPSEFTVEQTNKNNGLLSKAQEMIDQEHDDVKHMNQMQLYSKVVTIRDKQLEESKQLERDWLNEQKKLDLMMEIERLKSLQAMEERERLKHEAQKRGASVIIEQIKEREIERIREQELREKEMAQMQKQVEAMREQERQAAEAKRKRAAEMMKEVEESNRIALSAKNKRIQEERDEDMKIFRYNQERALKEEERLAEERRVKAQKEYEVQKLRELQEKAQDRQAEIDALRAKRAFEEGERQARAKELAAIETKKKQMDDLEVARKKQFMERELMMAEQAKTERDAFLKVIEEQRKSEAYEREIHDEKNNALKSHAQCIR